MTSAALKMPFVLPYGRLAEVPFEDLTLKPQVRKTFRGIEELANSIAEVGLLSTLVVTISVDKYLLQAGERRYRAIKLLRERGPEWRERWSTVPCLVFDTDDATQLMLAQLAENTARSDLRPWESGAALIELRKTGLTQAEIGKRISKSQQWCSDHIRWAQFIHPDVQRTLGSMLPDAITRRLLDRLARCVTSNARGERQPNLEGQREIMSQLARAKGERRASARTMVSRIAAVRLDLVPYLGAEARAAVERALAHIEAGEPLERSS